MLDVPVPSGYASYQTSFSGTPGTSNGTAFTPGQNTKGTPVALGVTLTFDAMLVTIDVNSVAVSTLAKDGLLDLLYDPAGGTSWQVLIPDLLISCASGGSINQHITYQFPLLIPFGSTLAVQASVNNATVGSGRVFVKLHGDPIDPANAWAGTAVEAIGIVPGSSRGASVTPATGGSKGAYTALGTLANDCRYFQVGIGCNNAAMNTVNGLVDVALGDGTTAYDSVVSDMPFSTSSTESMWYGVPQNPPFCPGKAGATVWGRMLTSASPGTGFSLAAYGVR